MTATRPMPAPINSGRRLRFGKDQAPRLDRIIGRLERVGKKLGTGGVVDQGEPR